MRSSVRSALETARSRAWKGIDYLEHHIETFGTVVAQHPDVWGQTRLTKHRDEFERTMLKQLEQFQPTLQATVFRSDQPYLAMAFTLSAAAQSSTKSVTNVSAAAPSASAPSAGAPSAGAPSTTPSPAAPPASAAFDDLRCDGIADQPLDHPAGNQHLRGPVDLA